MEEKKSGSSATRAKNKWNKANYDTIALTVPKGQKELITEAAKKAGKSRNAFVYEAVMEKLERENMK